MAVVDIAKRIHYAPVVIEKMVKGFGHIGWAPRRELLVPRSHLPWSSEERDVVYTMLCQGEDVVDVAILVGRNVNAVTSKWDKIKLGFMDGNLLSHRDCSTFLSRLRAENMDLLNIVDTAEPCAYKPIDVPDEKWFTPDVHIKQQFSPVYDSVGRVVKLETSVPLSAWLAKERVAAKDIHFGLGDPILRHKSPDPIIQQEWDRLVAETRRNMGIAQTLNIPIHMEDQLRTTKIDLHTIRGIDFAKAEESVAVSFLAQQQYKSKQQGQNMNNIVYSVAKLLQRAETEQQKNKEALALRDRMAKAITSACEDAVATCGADVDKERFNHFSVTFSKMHVTDNQKSFEKVITVLKLAGDTSISFNADVEWLLRDFTQDNGGATTCGCKEFKCPQS